MNPKTAQTRRRSNERRNGVAATEFVVCLPVLTLLVLGTIEASSMVFLKQSLAIAAYEGTRTAITPGATTADVTATVTQIATDRRMTGVTVQVAPGGNVTSIATGQPIIVTVSAPCDGNTLISGTFSQGATITQSCTFMKEF